MGSLVVELGEMGDHYMLVRYLSNNVQYTDRVPQWSVEDVCQWLEDTQFQEFCQVFRQVGVDGDLLLPLREREMREDLEMTKGIVRRRFLRELRNLKRISDYSCVDAEEIAEFLSGIQPDLREYTYNLYKADMTVDSMAGLSSQDLMEMLEEAGVENKVHQYMISESLMVSPASSSCSPTSPEPSSPAYEVYLTSPDRRGAELCSLIKIQLEMRGISVFYSDPSTRRNDKIIQDSQHFVLVLPKDSLDCMKLSHSEPDNKIRAEIVTALEAEVNIIPVTDHGFQWLAKEDMHEDVRDVQAYNSVRWVHEYQDACITKLDKFIRGGDNQLKIDSPYLCRSLARSRQSSGRSTPLGMSRKSSATPFSSYLLHPRNISLRRSSLSLYSNDSGVDNFS